MNVPTVFANGCHLDLSLSGSKVAVLESMKIKSLNGSIHQKRPSLNQNDVLPSITPSSESLTPDPGININQSGSLIMGREVNIIIEEGSKQKEWQPLRSEVKSNHSNPISSEIKEVWVKEKSITSVLESTCNDHMSQEEDLWEDEDDHQNQNKECVPPTKHKKAKKKKKRCKSKQSQKSSKINRLKTAEDVYTDMSLLNNNAHIEAFCMPANIVRISPHKPRNKQDYSKYINDKAPAVVTKVVVPSKTEILLKKTKNIINSVSSKSRYIQVEKTTIEKSPYTNNVANKILSASADPLTFKINVNKSNTVIQRKSLGSAPSESTIQRLIKVYLSEKQSEDIEELGMEVPAAPPGTPAPEMLMKFDYVPCMHDIRAQRAVKLKLDYMAKIEKQRQEKIKEEKMKKDKIHQKEKVRELRRQQRREIYALNKKMTEFEHKNFLEFCKQNGLPSGMT